MDYDYSSTTHARGKHLALDERGQIQALRREGHSLREIGKVIGCSPSTVLYELRRGTPERTHRRGRPPQYTAKRGQKAYTDHRKNCRKPLKIDSDDCEAFIQWLASQVKQHHWSIDECVGYARRMSLFPPEAIPCTKTIYNMLHREKLPLTLFDVPKVLKRRKSKRLRSRKNKRVLGRSIEERPPIAGTREEFGHWEADTVVGRREGHEPVVFTLLEKKSRKYIAIKIPGRNSAGVDMAMKKLQQEFGEHFKDVFKTITPDNGPEFSTFSHYEETGTGIYFTHPYSSSERAQNERHNGMLREYLPKGASIENYTAEEVLRMADEINSRPRRILGYHTADELFKAFLDEVYAIRA